MTGQRKDQRLAEVCAGEKEREGSNLIWLKEDVLLCVRVHGVCVHRCATVLHSVTGLWEWDRRAERLNGASRARSSGESPQTLKEGLDQRGGLPD